MNVVGQECVSPGLVNKIYKLTYKRLIVIYPLSPEFKISSASEIRGTSQLNVPHTLLIQ